LKIAESVGWYIDVTNEEKWLVRDGGVNQWVGPGAATDAELKLWVLLLTKIVTKEAKEFLESL